MYSRRYAGIHGLAGGVVEGVAEGARALARTAGSAPPDGLGTPVTRRAKVAVALHHEQRAGRQLRDAFVERAPRKEPRHLREPRDERLLVDPARDARVGHDSVGLGGEHEAAVPVPEMERPEAGVVART